VDELKGLVERRLDIGRVHFAERTDQGLREVGQ
jgi:hypothetical protein